MKTYERNIFSFTKFRLRTASASFDCPAPTEFCKDTYVHFQQFMGHPRNRVGRDTSPFGSPSFQRRRYSLTKSLRMSNIVRLRVDYVCRADFDIEKSPPSSSRTRARRVLRFFLPIIETTSCRRMSESVPPSGVVTEAKWKRLRVTENHWNGLEILPKSWTFRKSTYEISVVENRDFEINQRVNLRAHLCVSFFLFARFTLRSQSAHTTRVYVRIINILCK